MYPFEGSWQESLTSCIIYTGLRILKSLFYEQIRINGGGAKVIDTFWGWLKPMIVYDCETEATEIHTRKEVNDVAYYV